MNFLNLEHWLDTRDKYERYQMGYDIKSKDDISKYQTWFNKWEKWVKTNRHVFEVYYAINVDYQCNREDDLSRYNELMTLFKSMNYSEFIMYFTIEFTKNMCILEYLNKCVICNDDEDFGIDLDDIDYDAERWKNRKELYKEKIKEELS